MSKRENQVSIILGKQEKAALNALKREGFQKNNWIVRAIREKLARDGLLQKEKKT